MTNTLVKNITVKNINELLQGSVFTIKNLTEDYPTETISHSFGDFSYNSDYKHEFVRRTPEQLAELDKQFDKIPLPF